MNLKDAILSTISEIQNHEDIPADKTGLTENKTDIPPFKINQTAQNPHQKSSFNEDSDERSEIIEDRFLQDLRERILVLFEGFQSPNNAKIEAKVDLTLNFLEHLLAKIDAKLEEKK